MRESTDMQAIMSIDPGGPSMGEMGIDRQQPDSF